MSASPVVFAAGSAGPWSLVDCRAICGDGLSYAPRLACLSSDADLGSAAWSLTGIVSHLRYATRDDVEALRPIELPLSRPEATLAALIPIRKSAAWWAMAQDERDNVFASRSRHRAIGQVYARSIARKLYHSRDLGGSFDFLTWFEFEPEAAGHFDELLASLRATPEWEYVEREVEVRLIRESTVS